MFSYKRVDYAHFMATRPQTLYGIADSPAGLAAWLLDHGDGDGQPATALVAALDRTTTDADELTRDVSSTTSRSIQARGAGRSRRITISSTTTNLKQAGILQHGNSLSYLRRRYARA